MDTYALQRLILQSELLPTEKLVGMIMALHVDSRTGKIRLSRAFIARTAGVSESTVKRAVKGLVDAGIFAVKKTGRSNIFSIASCSGKNSGRVDGSPMTRQKGHIDHFTVDTTHSTAAEERQKRNER